MNRFLLVLGNEDDDLSEKVAREFPAHYELVERLVWFIAVPDDKTTTADIVQVFAPDDHDQDQPQTLVMKAYDCAGFTERALWERLEEWRKSGE